MLHSIEGEPSSLLSYDRVHKHVYSCMHACIYRYIYVRKYLLAWELNRSHLSDSFCFSLFYYSFLHIFTNYTLCTNVWMWMSSVTVGWSVVCMRAFMYAYIHTHVHADIQRRYMHEYAHDNGDKATFAATKPTFESRRGYFSAVFVKLLTEFRFIY